MRCGAVAEVVAATGGAVPVGVAPTVGVSVDAGVGVGVSVGVGDTVAVASAVVVAVGDAVTDAVAVAWTVDVAGSVGVGRMRLVTKRSYWLIKASPTGVIALLLIKGVTPVQKYCIAANI